MSIQPGSEAIIRTAGLTRRYDKLVALSELDLASVNACSNLQTQADRGIANCARAPNSTCWPVESCEEPIPCGGDH